MQPASTLLYLVINATLLRDHRTSMAGENCTTLVARPEAAHVDQLGQLVNWDASAKDGFRKSAYLATAISAENEQR